MSVTATSRVATERGERYRKQLASHFGNKIEVVEEPGGTVLRAVSGGWQDDWHENRRGRGWRW